MSLEFTQYLRTLKIKNSAPCRVCAATGRRRVQPAASPAARASKSKPAGHQPYLLTSVPAKFSLIFLVELLSGEFPFWVLTFLWLRGASHAHACITDKLVLKKDIF